MSDSAPDSLPDSLPDSPPDSFGDPVADSEPEPIPDPTTEITVVNNEAGRRYEAWLGEALAGFSQYTLDDGLITFQHTQVADAFEGKGVASVLVRSALEDVRATGTRKVRAVCPFVRAFLKRHRDYQDVLYAGTD